MKKPRMSKTIAFDLYIILFFLFVLAPIAILIVVSVTSARFVSFPPIGFSLKWFVSAIEEEIFIDSFLLSIKLAALATFVSLIIGTMASLGVTRYEFPGKNFLITLFTSPLLVPSFVFGVALMIFFTRLFRISTFYGLLLGHIIIITPFIIRTISAALLTLETTYEEAAHGLGASKLKVFFKITLPLIWPGILGGALIAFILSFDNVTLCLFVNSPTVITLPVVMYDYISWRSVDPTIAALSTMIILLSVGIVITIKIVFKNVGEFTRMMRGE